ncbi:IclR family transcriptional regulator [Pelobacter seleniigenes]|uniref:IclR family transcriptional regulator n=1 Tax=Pelobacter seleniigenes TaxID=407188 RepID=UPI0004A70861|nr:IclR family transcriptional regulator [Pelobacter seleniigenes]
MNPLYKIFAILEAVVAQQSRGVTYSDVVAAVDLPKSSVHRILRDLTDVGYLDYNPESKKYFGSLRLAATGAEVMTHYQLRKHVRPHLEALNKATGHTTNLGVLDGTMGVFVEKIESKDYGIRLFSEVGKRFPLYCTGMGKSMLAFAEAETIDKVLAEPLPPLTDKTVTNPNMLRKQLLEIREQGYALDLEEITRGIVCVAAPLLGFRRQLVGAISITVPSYLLDERGIESEIEAVKRCAAVISQSLGC